MEELVIYFAYSPEDAPYDRDAIGNGIRALNDIIRTQGSGKYLRLVECEDCSIDGCDPRLVVSLSVQHAGGLEILRSLLSRSQQIPGVLTFFCTKGDHAPSYLEMMDWVDEKLHYRTEYDHVSQAREQLFLHLLRYKPFAFTLEDSAVVADGQAVIRLDETGMLSRTPEYRSLCQTIEAADQTRLKLRSEDPGYAANPEYLAAQEAWQKACDAKEQYIKDVYTYWSEASCTPTLRQQLADAACVRGDLDGALRVLQLDELELEYEQEMQREAMEAQIRRRQKQQRVEEVLQNIRLQLQKVDDPLRFSKVKKAYEFACRIERENDLPRKALKDYADHLLFQAEAEAALPVIREALEYAESTQDLWQQAEIWDMFSVCYGYLGETENAISAFNDAIRLFGALADDGNEDALVSQAKTRLSMAEFLMMKGRTTQARKQIDEALLQCNTLPVTHPARAYLMEPFLVALGDLHKSMGNSAEVAEAYRLALNVRLALFPEEDPQPLVLIKRYIDHCAACLQVDPPADTYCFQAKRSLRQIKRLQPAVADQAPSIVRRLSYDMLFLEGLLASRYEKDPKKAESRMLDAIGVIKGEDRLVGCHLEALAALADLHLEGSSSFRSVCSAAAYLREAGQLMAQNPDKANPHWIAVRFRDAARLPEGKGDRALLEEAAHWLWKSVLDASARLRSHPNSSTEQYFDYISGLSWALWELQDRELAQSAYDDLLEVSRITCALSKDVPHIPAQLHYSRGILARVIELHGEVAPELAQWIELRLEHAEGLSDDSAAVLVALSLDAADSAMKVKKPSDAARVLKNAKELLLSNPDLTGLRDSLTTVCTVLAKAYEKDGRSDLSRQEHQLLAKLRK